MRCGRGHVTRSRRVHRTWSLCLNQWGRNRSVRDAHRDKGMSGSLRKASERGACLEIIKTRHFIEAGYQVSFNPSYHLCLSVSLILTHTPTPAHSHRIKVLLHRRRRRRWRRKEKGERRKEKS